MPTTPLMDFTGRISMEEDKVIPHWSAPDKGNSFSCSITTQPQYQGPQ